ncbi:hypothetical protein ACFL1H_03625 [Nanoarchaeota archaeon]
MVIISESPLINEINDFDVGLDYLDKPFTAVVLRKDNLLQRSDDYKTSIMNRYQIAIGRGEMFDDKVHCLENNTLIECFGTLVFDLSKYEAVQNERIIEDDLCKLDPNDCYAIPYSDKERIVFPEVDGLNYCIIDGYFISNAYLAPHFSFSIDPNILEDVLFNPLDETQQDINRVKGTQPNEQDMIYLQEKFSKLMGFLEPKLIQLELEDQVIEKKRKPKIITENDLPKGYQNFDIVYNLAQRW